jgi:predicted Zn-dependent protease
MKKTACLVVSTAALVMFAGCRNVPGSGRSQAAWFPESTLDAQAAQEFESIKKQQGANNPAMLACLHRVGKRIVTEARKLDGTLPPYEKWEFVVVNDNSANAFAMPGGKVAFNTGIFSLMSSDDEVAVVMGHEVSHVIARHGNERVTQNILAQVGATGVALASSAYIKSDVWRTAINTGYGVGAQYGVMLPFSRTHESEADIIGIHLSAKAGYDPQVAIGFWEKMSAGGGAPPEFLSTHPSGSTRINDLRKEMPNASAEYQKAKTSGLPAGENLNFPKAAPAAATKPTAKAANQPTSSSKLARSR